MYLFANSTLNDDNIIYLFIAATLEGKIKTEFSH